MSSVTRLNRAAEHERNCIILSSAGYRYTGRWTQIATEWPWERHEESSQEFQRDYLVTVSGYKN